MDKNLMRPNQFFCKQVRIFLFGQLIAFLIACMTILASLNCFEGVGSPGVRVFLISSGNAVFYGFIRLAQSCSSSQKSLSPLASTYNRQTNAADAASIDYYHSVSHPTNTTSNHKPAKWWEYFICAFLYVGALYTSMTSFEKGYTSTVEFLYSLKIPHVFILSYFIIGKRYCYFHYAGCTLGLVGLLVIFVRNMIENPDDKDIVTHITYDVCTCFAGFSLAICDVLQERILILNTHPRNLLDERIKYLCNVGLYGTFISILIFVTFESGFDILNGQVRLEVLACAVTYTVISIVLGFLISLCIQKYGAVEFHIFILPIQCYVFQLKHLFVNSDSPSDSYVFFVALAVIYAGIIVYLSRETRSQIINHYDTESE